MDKLDLAKKVEALIMKTPVSSLNYIKGVRGRKTAGFKFNFGGVQAFLYSPHEYVGDSRLCLEIKLGCRTLYYTDLISERDELYEKRREYGAYAQKIRQDKEERKKRQAQTEEERRLAKAEKLLERFGK